MLSSSRGLGNFRGPKVSRPRPRTSKFVLEDVFEAKDVLEDSTSDNTVSPEMVSPQNGVIRGGPPPLQHYCSCPRLRLWPSLWLLKSVYHFGSIRHYKTEVIVVAIFFFNLARTLIEFLLSKTVHNKKSVMTLTLSRQLKNTTAIFRSIRCFAHIYCVTIGTTFG